MLFCQTCAVRICEIHSVKSDHICAPLVRLAGDLESTHHPTPNTHIANQFGKWHCTFDTYTSIWPNIANQKIIALRLKLFAHLVNICVTRFLRESTIRWEMPEWKMWLPVDAQDYGFSISFANREAEKNHMSALAKSFSF